MSNKNNVVDPSKTGGFLAKYFGGKDNSKFIVTMLSPTGFVFILGVFFPIVYGVYTSLFFYGADELQFVGIGHYINLTLDETFRKYYFNTLMFTFVTVFFEFILGLGIALLLDKEFKGRGLVRAAVLVPWALPTIVNAQLWRYFFKADQLGPVNDLALRAGLIESPRIWQGAGETFDLNFIQLIFITVFIVTLLAIIVTWGTRILSGKKIVWIQGRNDIVILLTFIVTSLLLFLPLNIYAPGQALGGVSTEFAYDWVVIFIVDIWKTTPFMALLILAGLQVVPRDLEKAARVDGANSWQIFRKITWPLILPSVGVSLIFRCIDAFRVYDILVILGTRDQNSITAYAVEKIRGGFLGEASAVAVITFFNIILFAVFFLYLTRRRVD